MQVLHEASGEFQSVQISPGPCLIAFMSRNRLGVKVVPARYQGSTAASQCEVGFARIAALSGRHARARRVFPSVRRRTAPIRSQPGDLGFTVLDDVPTTNAPGTRKRSPVRKIAGGEGAQRRTSVPARARSRADKPPTAMPFSGPSPCGLPAARAAVGGSRVATRAGLATPFHAFGPGTSAESAGFRDALARTSTCVA